ncbi:MAG: hypothetical protein AABX32_03345 [Nanoarchaeota archaeon]
MDIDQFLAQYRERKAQNDRLTRGFEDLNKQIGAAQTRKVRNSLTEERDTLQTQMDVSKSSLVEILSQYHAQLVIVPGDETRFEQMVGYPVEVVVLGIPNKGALIVEERGGRSYNGFKGEEYATPLRLLLENRVVGLINAQLTQSDWSSRWDRGTERIYYGLPVAKKAQ